MALDTDRSKIAHLLRRAGFGATPAELHAYTQLGFNAALDRLLHPEQVDNSASDQQVQPLLLDPGLVTDMTTKGKIEQVKYGWLVRMLTTQRPLQEKMALFWHNHFATAQSKVGNAVLMQQQAQLFRDNGLGSFETLFQKVTRDPAMLIWLDNRLNRKASPNENYARESMELFSLGIGNYSQDDVTQGARAFTGYTLDKNLNSVFTPAQHDSGQKTILGVTKNFDADDVLDLDMHQPSHAPFLTTELFRYFVYDTPDPSTISRLSNTYVSSGFDVRSVLKDIFTGPEFLSPQAYHGIVKQPADFVVSALKALNVQNVGPDLSQTVRRMGQDLLNPPDVSGWAGGAAWINSTTIFERLSFADRLAMGRTASQPYFTDIPGQLAAAGVTDDQSAVTFLTGLLVDGDVTPDTTQNLVSYLNQPDPFSMDPAVLDQKGRGVAHLVMALPTFQLA